MLLEHRRVNLISVKSGFPEVLTTYLEGQISSSPVKKRVQAFQVEIYKFLNGARILSAYEAKTRNETREIGRVQNIKTLSCHAVECKISSKSIEEALTDFKQKSDTPLYFRRITLAIVRRR